MTPWPFSLTSVAWPRILSVSATFPAYRQLRYTDAPTSTSTASTTAGRFQFFFHWIFMLLPSCFPLYSYFHCTTVILSLPNPVSTDTA